MGFLNKIMIHLGEATETALADSGIHLDERLEIVLKEILNKSDKGLIEEMKALNIDTVYFVLNATEMGSKDRAFVAGLNTTHLDPKIKNGEVRFGNGQSGFGEELSQNIKTIIFTTNGESLDASAEIEIQSLWNDIWNHYYDLTLQFEKNDPPKLTFNHLLLNYVKNPLNIGFYWGEPEPEADESYFYLPKEILNELGIEVSGSELLQMKECKDIESNSNKVLKGLQDKIKRMKPFNEDLFENDISGLPFTIFQLLKFYGCWGGRAFYSIPVQFGKDEGRKMGILSICTTKPMSEDLVFRWSLIASKVFKDIILNELDKFEEYKKNVGISVTLHQIKTFVEGVLDSPINKLDSSMPSLKSNPDFIKLIKGRNDIVNTANIINLITKLSTKKKSEIVDKKDLLGSSYFSESKIASIQPIIEEIIELRKLDSRKKTVLITTNGCEEIDDFLKCGSTYPSELFFKLFLLTVVENTANYGKEIDNVRQLELKYDTAKKCLVARNIPENACDPLPKKNKLTGNFKAFDIILDTLEIGQLEFDKENEDGVSYFVTRLKSNC